MIKAILLPFAAILIIQAACFLLRPTRGAPPPSPRTTPLPRRLRLAGLLVLATGLLSAVAVYLHPPIDSTDNAIGYDLAAGKIYPILPGQSKRYELQQEAVGGKANVVINETVTQLTMLYHSRNFAYVIASFAGGVCLACFIVARLLAE